MSRLKFNKSMLRIIARLSVYFPLSLLVIIALMVNSDIGSKIAINLVDTLVTNVNIEYQSGSINKQLQLNHIQWQGNGVLVKANEFTVAWKPSCLLKNQLCINKLESSELKILINNPSATDSGSNSEKRRIAKSDPEKLNNAFHLPIKLSVKQADINSIALRLNEQVYQADHLSFKGNWLASGLTIDQLDSDGLLIKIPRPHSTEKASVSTKVPAMSETSQPSWLPTMAMPFPLRIGDAHIKNSHLSIYNQIIPVRDAKLTATWVKDSLTFKRLELQNDWGNIAINGSIQLSENYPLTLSSHIDTDNINILLKAINSPLQNNLQQVRKLRLNTKLEQDLSALAVNANLTGDITATLNSTVNLVNPERPFSASIKQLSGSWQQQDVELLIADTNIVSNGNIDKITLNLDGTLSSKYTPAFTITSNATVKPQQVTINKFTAKSKQSMAQVSGNISWNKGINWQLDTNFQQFSFGNITKSLAKHLPTTLINGHFSTQGFLNKQQWRISVSDANINGNLKQAPLAITGGFDIHSQLDSKLDVHSAGFAAKLLNGNITVKQDPLQKHTTQATFAFNDLMSIMPQFSGDIHGNAQFDSINNELTYNGKIADLRYQDLSVSSLNLTGQYQPNNQHKNTINIKSKRLQFKKLKLKQANFDVVGNNQRQSLQANLKGKVSLTTSVNANLDSKNGDWRFTIPLINIRDKQANWNLNQTIIGNWQPQSKHGKLSPFCLTNKAQGLCLDQVAEFGDTGKVKMSFKGIINDLARLLLPTHLRLTSMATATANISWDKHSKPIAKFTSTLEQGKLTLYPNRKISAEYPFKSISLIADLQQDKLSVNSVFDAKHLSHWDANVEITTDPKHRLSGKVNINHIALAPFAEFFPMFETLHGNINSKLLLSGTLSQPKLLGDINVHKADITLTSNPTTITDLELAIKFNDQHSLINSTWNMGAGKGQLAGSVAWNYGQLTSDMRISGQGLTLIQPPLAILTVSPKVSISQVGKRISIKGDLNVDKGNITITPLPKEGVALSDDVIFTDKRVQPIKPINLDFRTDLSVYISDKLKINGMGLDGNLAGKLTYSKKVTDQPLLFGNIKVLNGSYRFMGQKLTIRQGGLEFIGTSNNPNLNIEAVKNIAEEDLIVGVKITGTAERPIVNLFSDPIKDQAEIVSYLLQGKGLENADQQSNNGLLLSAALTLGSHVSNNPLSGINDSAESVIEKLGVSNVQLDANDEGKLAISGYIGKDLLVKYGYGLFNPGYELTVRYYLLSQLYIEGISSALGQSLDVYYRFEIE
ncbi:MAG: translocation/assembly module TamB domain-containing protein [Psychrobium sp.]